MNTVPGHAIVTVFIGSIFVQGLAALAVAAHAGAWGLKRCIIGIFSVYHVIAAYAVKEQAPPIATAHAVLAVVRVPGWGRVGRGRIALFFSEGAARCELRKEMLDRRGIFAVRCRRLCLD